MNLKTDQKTGIFDLYTFTTDISGTLSQFSNFGVHLVYHNVGFLPMAASEYGNLGSSLKSLRRFCKGEANE